MHTMMADGHHYFGDAGFPVTLRRVSTDATHMPSHPHDLTEIEHYHDFCELVITTRGRAIHSLEGREFPISSGDIFLLQGQQRHYFHSRNDLELINIMYDPQKLPFPENELKKLPGYCAIFILEPTQRWQHRFASRLHLKPVSFATVENIARVIEAECTEKRPGWEASTLGALIELIVYLSRVYDNSETRESHALLRIGNVIGAIEKDPSRDWKLDDLVDIADMSRSNLIRVFNNATGQTPIDYLILIRLQRAMDLLRNSSMPITEIAYKVGFRDSNYFSRQFRKVLKTTPREYRKTNIH